METECKAMLICTICDGECQSTVVCDGCDAVGCESCIPYFPTLKGSPASSEFRYCNKCVQGINNDYGAADEELPSDEDDVDYYFDEDDGA